MIKILHYTLYSLKGLTAFLVILAFVNIFLVIYLEESTPLEFEKSFTIEPTTRCEIDQTTKILTMRCSTQFEILNNGN